MARLDMIGIVTEHLDASLDFYRRLGVDIPPQEGPHVEATLPSGLRMGWDTVDVIRSFDPDWTPPTGSTGVGLAFLCDDAADVDATYDAFPGRGHKTPWDAAWGQRYAVVLDPDGNEVSLFAPLDQ